MELTGKMRGMEKEMPEEDVIPLLQASLLNSNGLLIINALESTDNLTVKCILNKIFEEQTRVNECKQTNSAFC